MTRRHFDPIQYSLEKIAILNSLLEKYPQCEDCEHMNFWGFSPKTHKITLEKYCSQCPKFTKKMLVYVYNDELEIGG